MRSCSSSEDTTMRVKEKGSGELRSSDQATEARGVTTNRYDSEGGHYSVVSQSPISKRNIKVNIYTKNTDPNTNRTAPPSREGAYGNDRELLNLSSPCNFKNATIK